MQARQCLCCITPLPNNNNNNNNNNYKNALINYSTTTNSATYTNNTYNAYVKHLLFTRK